jgi:pimeloyl-ACP methyl ester carboxylesterase
MAQGRASGATAPVVTLLLEENDARVFRVATAGERWQLAHIPGAKFIVPPKAAHSMNWEQPEAFKRNLLQFVMDWR